MRLLQCGWGIWTYAQETCTWCFSRGESGSMCGVWKLCQVPALRGRGKVALTPPTSSHCHHIHLGPGCLLSCQPGSGRDPDSAKGILAAGAASPLRTLSPAPDILRGVESQRCPVGLHGGCHHCIKQYLPHQLLVAWGQNKRPNHLFPP